MDWQKIETKILNKHQQLYDYIVNGSFKYLISEPMIIYSISLYKCQIQSIIYVHCKYKHQLSVYKLQRTWLTSYIYTKHNGWLWNMHSGLLQD